MRTSASPVSSVGSLHAIFRMAPIRLYAIDQLDTNCPARLRNDFRSGILRSLNPIAPYAYASTVIEGHVLDALVEKLPVRVNHRVGRFVWVPERFRKAPR